MHVTSGLLALLAAIMTISSTLAWTPDYSSVSGLENFWGGCSDEGCVWEDIGNSVSWCSCNTDTDENDIDFMAKFYTLVSYRGDLFNVYGKYGQCYNLPEPWYANGGSMTTNADETRYCVIYTQPGCVNNPFIVATNIEQFKGLYENGIRSIICEALPGGS